jgi:hypothetical protein
VLSDKSSALAAPRGERGREREGRREREREGERRERTE